MSHIFISYSRRDKPQALSLAERLRAAGCNVWIDLHGIDAATSWSREIVGAIDACNAFLLLVSPSSLASHNVIKEVSLASEARKPIVPVDLEGVELSADLRYQLAGLQRVAYDNFEAILRGLERLGAGGTLEQSPKAPQPEPPADARLTLAVLPFDDLSPAKDNGWFADGLTEELINVLSGIGALRVTDRRTVMEYRSFKGGLHAIASGLNVRYIIEGAVRKHAGQIKITIGLFDSGTKDYLWNTSHRGVMDDIFDIQESVATKTAEALKLSLSLEEKEKIASRPTESAEAYELYLRAIDYQERQTKEHFEIAITLLDEAIKIDPRFAAAYAVKATLLCNVYRLYKKDAAYLDEADSLIQKAILLEPHLAAAFFAQCMLMHFRGETGAALQAAERTVELEPNTYRGYFSMAFVYAGAGDSRKAIQWYRRGLSINPEILIGHWNLFIHYGRLADDAGKREVASSAIPLFERRLKLNPDNQFNRIALANFYVVIGRQEEIRPLVEPLIASPSTDAQALYNLGCLYVASGFNDEAITLLRSALERGFSDFELIRTDPDLTPLRTMPAFEKLLSDNNRNSTPYRNV